MKTLPWSWYTDPAVLQLERERIFRRSWQYVGHAGEVAEPGSFAATRVGDVPVVVVRDREDVRKLTALLAHQNYLYESLTARENLEVVADHLGVRVTCRSRHEWCARSGALSRDACVLSHGSVTRS